MDGEMLEIIKEQHKLVRPQPTDDNHLRLSKSVIDDWADSINGSSVLDIGCGQAIAKELWESHGYRWSGIAIGRDVSILENRGISVRHRDMHDMSWCGDVDVAYARHVLEHSPFPIVALKAWREITRWCILVVPAPSETAYSEITHLSIFPEKTWIRYIQFAGWDITEFRHVPYNNPKPWPQVGSEYRWLLKS